MCGQSGTCNVSRAFRWRFVVVLVATVVGAAYLSLTKPGRLRLGLRGGTDIVPEARETDCVTVDAGSALIVVSHLGEVPSRR